MKAADEIGEAVDTLENLIAASEMPLPDHIHVTCLRNCLRKLVPKLKDAYVELTGENPWSTS